MWPIKLIAVGLCATGCIPRASGYALKELGNYAIAQPTEGTNGLDNLSPKPLECRSEEMYLHGTFTPYDYSVVMAMLVISLGIGKSK